jgi:hypothetical protein
MREPNSVSQSSCESEIYATNEGSKSAMTIRHLSADLGLDEANDPTIIWNDNQGCVDWTKGTSVSKKLRHLNMRELVVRQYQKLGKITIRHIEGKANISNIFTKEIKDPVHFRSMAFTLTTPHLIRFWNHVTGETLVE